MIFVNDASTDSSLSLLLEMQKTFPITIINMSRRFGVTPCVLAGFEYTKGDAVIYMDSDLQDPPELIIDMAKKWLSGSKFIVCEREKRTDPLATKLLANIYYKFSSSVFPGIQIQGSAVRAVVKLTCKEI